MSERDSNFPRRPALLSLALALLVLATFLSAMHNGFVSFDDPQYVTNNPEIQRGLTLATFRHAFQTTIGGNWHPVTLLSHALDYQCFGLNPRAHHLTSILLHTANTVLLFVVLHAMTGFGWRSFFVAALFGLHPLRVESVAWVAERKDVLSGLFWMLTLWAYARFVRSRAPAASTPPARRWNRDYVLALLFFTLGLLSKPMLVTLPCVLLLLDYWPLKRFPDSRFELATLKTLALEKIPFFALTAVFCVITLKAQAAHGAVRAIADLSLAQRAENAVVSCARYLGKCFWPADLAVFYPQPAHWPSFAVLMAVLLVLGLSAAALILARRRPYLPVGWFWFAGMLVPVIGLVQVGMQSMADRYTYLPSIGLSLALVWTAAELARRRPNGWRPLATAGGVVLLCLAVTTRRQIAHWADSETLFRQAIAATGENWLAESSLALALRKKGEMLEALAHYEKAVALNPAYVDARNNFSAALLHERRLDEAIVQLREAIRLDPRSASARNNLGDALFRRGDLDGAAAQFQEALHLRPNDRGAQSNLAAVIEEKSTASRTPP